MFETIQPAPPDPILGLTEAFKAETRARKINLGVGIYKDDAGQTPVLKSVKVAEEKLLKSETTKSYLPIEGEPDYGRLVQGLLFGVDHPVLKSGRAKTSYTPGGTGGLRVGADFLAGFLPSRKVWVSTPTWANHKGIFAAAGFEVGEYPYYDPETQGLDYAGMRAALAKVPAGEVVLLHVCCHNPTGVDLNQKQWEDLAALAKEKQWIPFLDFAYQGFGTGVENDRAGIAPFLTAGVDLLIASSFSKNMGLYRERTGALTLVAGSAEAAEAAFSQVKRTIRVNYSNPAAHGALIVQTILGDAGLTAQWLSELAEMRDRIAGVRAHFVRALKEKGIDRDFSFIESQTGMFSFSGLTDAQVEFLRKSKGIYMVKGGRINVAGITTSNLNELCDAIAEALA